MAPLSLSSLGITTSLFVVDWPDDLVLECGASTDPANTGSPENLEVEVDWTYTDAYSGECPVVIERTWTGEVGGETLTHTQVITLEDTQAPVFETAPSTLELACDGTGDWEPEVSDCSAFTLVLEEVETEGCAGGDDCGQYRTQTPGGWGAPANGNNPGVYRDAHFDQAFPDGLTVGCTNTLTLTSAAAVQAFLPAGGQPAVLPDGALEDPTGMHNNLANHLVALTLSLGFDAIDPDFSEADGALGDLVYNSGDFEGYTIQEVVDLANEVLGGCSTAASPSDLVGALSMANENFVDGDSDNGNFDCESGSVEGCFYTERTYTATDVCGNTSTLVVCVAYQDTTAPVVESAPEDTFAECGETASLEPPVFSDACDSNLQIELVIEPIGTSNCISDELYVWTATDNCGNSTSVSAMLSVSDTTPPVAMDAPEDMTVACDMIPPAPEVTFEDACSTVSVTYEEITGEGCPYTITRTWTATDGCNNTSTVQQTLTVVDEEAPLLIGVPDDVVIGCGEEPAPAVVIALDNCDPNVSVSLNATTEDGDCGVVLTRTWSAEDNCGNLVTATQVVSFEDVAPPVFEALEAEVTLSCGDDLPEPGASASDACSEVTITHADEEIPGDCPGTATVVRTYVATDACGNQAELVQTFLFEDNTPPVFDNQPEDLVLTCGDPLPEPDELTASDNCDPAVEVVFTSTLPGGNGETPEGALSHCLALDPPNQEEQMWSLVLFGMPYEQSNQYYLTQSMTWTVYPDAGDGQSAVLEGSVVSTSNPNAGWHVYAEYENGIDWDAWSNQDFPTSYKDDFGVAGDNYLDWMYYIMTSDVSTLTGWGDLEGSLFELSHEPASFFYGFQEGLGASNADENGELSYGIGGWMAASGTLVDAAADINTTHSGAGDFAFALDCCPQEDVIWTWTATDCAGNETSVSATVSFVEAAGLVDLEAEASAFCPADVDKNGAVGSGDMLLMLSDLGCENGDCPGDGNADGRTDTTDILLVLGLLGTTCP